MEDDIHCNDVCVLYKPRSDFINLSKLNVLGLARKLEAGKRGITKNTNSEKMDLGEYGESNRHHRKWYEDEVGDRVNI